MSFAHKVVLEAMEGLYVATEQKAEFFLHFTVL